MKNLFALVLAAVLAVGALALPALAQDGAGSGTINGTLTITPGLTTTPADNDFTFDEEAGMTAVVAGDTGDTYSGEVQNVDATGTERGGSCVSSDADGNVSTTDDTIDTLTFSGTDPDGNTIDGSGSGTFEREGSNVVLVVTGTATINDTTVDFTLHGEAEFLPTQGNCTDAAPVTRASFAGTYQAETVTP